MDIMSDKIDEQNAPSGQPDGAGEAPASGFREHTEGELSRQQIEESLSGLMEGINTKRKEDMTIVETIKKEIMAQATHSCQMIEKQMETMHEKKGKELEEAIKELMSKLDKIRLKEEALGSFRLSIQSLFKEMYENAGSN